MKTNGILILSTVLLTTAISAIGQGTFSIQHADAADPFTEGFGGQSYGTNPVFNDAGINAWATPSGTNSHSYYTYFLSPQQQLETIGADWTFSVNLRVVTPNVNTNNAAFYAGLDIGSEGYYRLLFGSAPNGDPYVAYQSLNYGQISNIINLTSAGSTYNNYQLTYDASANKASLWINGVQYANDISPLKPDYGFQVVYWGSDGGSTYAQANWNLVSLSIPEPSSAAVLLLGSGTLIYIRRKYLH